MTPEIVSLRIGNSIREAEQKLDIALLEVTKLMSTVTEARLEIDVPASTGHRAITRIGDTSSKLIAARMDLIRAHADMLKIAEERGDMLMDCPNAELPSTLREVA